MTSVSAYRLQSSGGPSDTAPRLRRATDCSPPPVPSCGQSTETKRIYEPRSVRIEAARPAPLASRRQRDLVGAADARHRATVFRATATRRWPSRQAAPSNTACISAMSPAPTWSTPRSPSRSTTTDGLGSRSRDDNPGPLGLRRLLRLDRILGPRTGADLHGGAV